MTLGQLREELEKLESGTVLIAGICDPFALDEGAPLAFCRGENTAVADIVASIQRMYDAGFAASDDFAISSAPPEDPTRFLEPVGPTLARMLLGPQNHAPRPKPVEKPTRRHVAQDRSDDESVMAEEMQLHPEGYGDDDRTGDVESAAPNDGRTVRSRVAASNGPE